MTAAGDVKRDEPNGIRVEIGLPLLSLFWFGIAAGLIVMLCVHLLTHGGPLPVDAKKPQTTVAAVVSHILLGKRVPPDDQIIALVHKKSGNNRFGRKDLAWYKTKTRQGKLRGQGGVPHVIDQKVARFRMLGRFSPEGVRI